MLYTHVHLYMYCILTLHQSRLFIPISLNFCSMTVLSTLTMNAFCNLPYGKEKVCYSSFSKGTAMSVVTFNECSAFVIRTLTIRQPFNLYCVFSVQMFKIMHRFLRSSSGLEVCWKVKDWMYLSTTQDLLTGKASTLSQGIWCWNALSQTALRLWWWQRLLFIRCQLLLLLLLLLWCIFVAWL